MSTTETQSDKIEVYENISDNVRKFNNKEEFMSYYENHKSEIDSMKTRGLNMKYTIPGFKIGKRANKITLYPIKDKENIKRRFEAEQKEVKDEFQEIYNQINQKLDIIYTTIDEIKNKIVISEPIQDLNRSFNKSNKINPWS